jgi:hypothetical protein
MSYGHPNSNITHFDGNEDRHFNREQSNFLNFGTVKKAKKQEAVVNAMNQTNGPSPLHQGFHGAGASSGTTPILHDFSHSSGRRADGVAGDDQPHFTMDIPDSSGRRARYHLYPNGDNTVFHDGQMARYPGENSYAIEHMNQYGQGVKQIPTGYQGVVEEQWHNGGGGEDEGEEGEPEGEEEHEMGDMPEEEMNHEEYPEEGHIGEA